MIAAVRENGSSTAFQYSIGGIGKDEACTLQLVADSCCTSIKELTHLQEEAIFNTLKIRLRSYKTVSNAVSICKAAQASGWSVIIAADEGHETLDTFLADFAVGVGATQFVPGSLCGGEGIGKLNRLLEIYRDNETMPFVGRSFRA